MSQETPLNAGSAVPARDVVARCLKTLTELRAGDLQDPEIRTALTAISATIQTLLSHRNEANSVPVSDTQEAIDGEFSAARNWRVKPKSTSERQEKKARLEKREAILRDLRSRVTRFRSEFETPPECAGARAEPTLDTFHERRRSAEFWPEGSVEWARQILAVEAVMTFAEMRQRYLTMVKICHPDHNPEAPADAMPALNRAWDVLRQQGSSQ